MTMNHDTILDCLTGVLPAAVTPLTEDGSIDHDGLTANLETWHDIGLSGYLILGSTGEQPLLSEFDRALVVETARRAIPDDQVLLVGTGQQGTAETIESTQRAADAGADAALVVAPNYYVPALTVHALVRHYATIADASPIPILLYSVPPLTGFALLPAVTGELAGHENIIGIKDSSGQPSTLLAIRRQTRPDFRILSGSLTYSLGALVDGAADGLILAMANVAPELCVEMREAVRQGDTDHARELHRTLLWLNDTISGVAGYKAAVEERGWAAGPPRSPLLPASQGARWQIREVLREVGLVPRS